MQFSVDGEERPISRAERRAGQVYTVNLGKETIEAGEEVRVSYTYRTVNLRDGHLLHFDIEQPTRGIEVELDYGDTDIASVTVLDFIASSERTHITRSSKRVPERSVEVTFDGWAFPKSGIAFVWQTGPIPGLFTRP